MNDYSFFPVKRPTRTGGLSAVRARDRWGHKEKKSKLKRKLQKAVNKVAREKIKEACALVESAKARAKTSVSLLLMLTKNTRISRRRRSLIEVTTRRLKRRGWKVLGRMQTIAGFHNEEESDCEPEFGGRRYATYLVISGFAKP